MIRAGYPAASLAAVLALTACATVPAPTQPPAAETISVAVGPCFGFCPVYQITLSPEGTLRFMGKRHTAILGDRSRDAGRPKYDALARDLAPFRPRTGTEARVECTAAVSDTSSFTITWTDGSGTNTVATVQGGCPGGPGKGLVTLLRDVPARLGVADWAQQTTRPGEPRG